MKTVITRLIIAAVLAVGRVAVVERGEAHRSCRRRARSGSRPSICGSTMTSTPISVGLSPSSQRSPRFADATTVGLAGRYGEVMEEANGDLDAEVLLAAANAAFRSHEREGGAGPAQVQRLDGVLQAYVAVLKAAPKHDWMRRTTTNTCRGCATRWREAPASP